MKRFVPKDGGDPPSGTGHDGRRSRNTERYLHCEKRRNDTHRSITDPEPGCSVKVPARRPSSVRWNCNGLIVDARLTEANGTAEHATALDLIEDNANSGSTVGAEKNYDTTDFVAGCRERGWTSCRMSRRSIPTAILQATVAPRVIPTI